MINVIYKRAENWKKKELLKIELIKKELIIKNADALIIKNYIDEQYDIIINKYNEKIKQYEYKKNNNVKPDKKAIKNLIQNIKILEGVFTTEKINEYYQKEYNIINNDVDLSNVNFIDN